MNIRSLLQKLVAIPTISGQPLPNNLALDYIESFLKERGMQIYRTAYNNSGALVATTQPTKTPRVMLVGHIDVVPASEGMFTLREEDGRLYGRGTLDMKSGLAGYLMAVDALQETLHDYDFGIMITSDEETLDLGIKGLLNDGFCPTEAAVLLDGAYDWQLAKAAKGALYMTITAEGKGGHGSRPWLADSASMRLIDLLAKIKQLFPRVDHQTNTLNISMIQAGKPGEALNQIPATAQAGLDVRTLNPMEHRRLYQEITALCQKQSVQHELTVEFKPIQHDMQEPHMQTFARSIEQHTAITPRGVLSLAASDANAFVDRGLACMVTYPLGAGHHSEEEWIDTKSLEDLPKILTTYLIQMAKVGERSLVEAALSER